MYCIVRRIYLQHGKRHYSALVAGQAKVYELANFSLFVHIQCIATIVWFGINGATLREFSEVGLI